MATAVQSIEDSIIQESIIRAVRRVCSSILKQEATFVEKTAEAAYEGFNDKPHVFGSVSFSGKVAGVVYLCIPDDFAQIAAKRVLGMTNNDAVHDVVGEITNMTVGTFKNALCNIGFPCKLSLPTIVRGDNLTVVALKGSNRHIFHFDCSGHRLVADIQIKQD